MTAAQVCIGIRRNPLALSGALLLLLLPSLAQAQSLRSRRDFSVGEHPVAFVAADYDGDGYLDLIVANQQTGGNGDVALVKGFGDGTFRRILSLTSGSLPTSVAYADVNGDGIKDLVVGNLRSQEVGVHLGNGAGGFGAKISTTIPDKTPNSIAVGDWNTPPDGKLDVAYLAGQQGNLIILMGDNTGRFPTTRQTLTVPILAKQVITSDFNNDAKADLAVVNSSPSNVQIYRGDGTGLFSLTNTLTTGAGPVSVLAADLNNDTRPDIATANFTADTVSIFLANATGGFNTPSTLSPGFGPRALAAGDLNNDSTIDLVVSMGKVSLVGQAALMTGNGTGGFTLLNTLFTGPAPIAAALGDFNRDGYLDVVTSNTTGDTVSVLQSTGPATYVTSNRIPLPVGAYPTAIVVSDLNGDGKRDYAAANESLNNLSVAMGDGLCGFTTVNSNTFTGVTPIAMVPGDFNRDNCVDLVTANYDDGTYSYLQSNCSGGFSASNGNQVGCPDPIAIAAGDINGDTNLDFAIVCEISGDLCTRPGNGVSGSTFGPAVCTPAATDTPEGLSIGRFSLDAFDDYAMTSSPNPGGDPTDIIAIARSDGAGGVLDIPATFPVGLAPRGIMKGDLNGDGYLDLVVANSNTASVSALLGDGGGVFSYPAMDAAVGLGPRAVAMADFNLDGKLDAAVVNANANTVTLLLGDGAGHFSPAGDFGVRGAPFAIGAGDCNNDGKPDLAVTDNFNDTISILVNQMTTGVDPLGSTSVLSSLHTVYRWGIVPGGAYDVIRGRLSLIAQGPTTNNLGPVTCLANDILVTDTGETPDNSNPAIGDAFFYLVRATVNGTTGSYTLAVPSGKPGIPSSGGCS